MDLKREALIMANARRIMLRTKSTSNAELYMDIFGMGFTTANEMCRKLGLNPQGNETNYNAMGNHINSAAQEKSNGWYCAHCKTGVDPSEVTFNEAHTACGRIITDDEPPAVPDYKSQRDRLLDELQHLVDKLDDYTGHGVNLLDDAKSAIAACGVSEDE